MDIAVEKKLHVQTKVYSVYAVFFIENTMNIMIYKLFYDRGTGYNNI